MPSVIRTEYFIRRLSKIDKSLLDRIEKLIIKIIQNPKVGKPMWHNRRGTRELYLAPFRLSYVYDKNNNKIIFLDFYHKDEQ